MSKNAGQSTRVVNIVVPVTTGQALSNEEICAFVANIIHAGEQASIGQGAHEYWEEDPDHNAEDWRYAVANGDTRHGYWEWVGAQKAEAAMEADLPEPKGPVAIGEVMEAIPPKAIVLADTGGVISNGVVDIDVFQEENFNMNYEESPEDTLGVSSSFRDLALRHGVPFGSIPEYVLEMMELLKESPMPCDVYNFWHLADENGWTIAHQAAKYRCLPADFRPWDLANENGWTVAHEAAYHGEKFSKNFKGLGWPDNDGVTVQDVANEYAKKNTPKMGM